MLTALTPQSQTIGHWVSVDKPMAKIEPDL
jgi:hypothetical protein